jgi:hypothetical protein
MSAVLTRRRRTGRGRERDHRQPSLFSQTVSPPVRVDEPARVDEAVVGQEVVVDAPTIPTYDEAPVDATVDRPRATLTLDEMISGLWGELREGETADCPVCGLDLLPRHSASAGVVGGRCSNCATTLA